MSTKDLDLFRIVLLWTSWIGFRVAGDVTVAKPEHGTTPTHHTSARAAATCIGDSDRSELTRLANDNSAKKLSEKVFFGMKKLDKERGDGEETCREFAREILRDSFLDLSLSQRQQQTTSALQAAKVSRTFVIRPLSFSLDTSMFEFSNEWRKALLDLHLQ